MIRRIRRVRKWLVNVWEGHHRSKVNGVLPWAQRLQHNPKSIGYRTTGQRARRAIINQLAYSKGFPFTAVKVKGGGGDTAR